MKDYKLAQFVLDEQVLSWVMDGTVFFKVNSQDEMDKLTHALYQAKKEIWADVVPSELPFCDFTSPKFVGVDTKNNSLCIGDYSFFVKHPLPDKGFSVVPITTLIEEINMPVVKVKQESTAETLKLLTERMHELEQKLFQSEQKVKANEHKKNA